MALEESYVAVDCNQLLQRGLPRRRSPVIGEPLDIRDAFILLPCRDPNPIRGIHIRVFPQSTPVEVVQIEDSSKTLMFLVSSFGLSLVYEIQEESRTVQTKVE